MDNCMFGDVSGTNRCVGGNGDSRGGSDTTRAARDRPLGGEAVRCTL